MSSERPKKPRKEPLTFPEIMKKIRKSGIEGSPSPNRTMTGLDELTTLDSRINKILDLVNQNNRPATNMIFFVMYDIEDNRVRTQIAKYLIRKGCSRVQRSVFLADLPGKIYENIRDDLRQVQAAYENNDSILIVPISTDYLTAMHVIGQTLDIDIITRKKNTLFF